MCTVYHRGAPYCNGLTTELGTASWCQVTSEEGTVPLCLEAVATCFVWLEEVADKTSLKALAPFQTCFPLVCRGFAFLKSYPPPPPNQEPV